MTQQITIFGANGKVGRQIVDEVLRRGYRVVAFVHGDASFTKNAQLRIIQGDIYNASDVDTAIQGSDVVISGLGSWGAPKKDILSVGMSHVIESMSRQGVTRIISLTGAEARASGDSRGVVHRLMHLVLGAVAGKVLSDGERHITQLESSQLDWTVIRSPIMSSASPLAVHETYDLTMKRPMPWVKISRCLVVLSMVDAVIDKTWVRKAPFISS